MAEISRSDVTITLGRTGQVVKKAGFVSETTDSGPLPLSGIKRSVRDRLGSNKVESLPPHSGLNRKRFRGGHDIQSNMGVSSLHDSHIGKDDLRFKLMRKNVNMHRQIGDRQNTVDLREKLSRTARPSTTSLDVQQNVPSRMGSNLFRRQIPPGSSHNPTQIHRPRNFYSPWTLDQLRQQPMGKAPSMSIGGISAPSGRNIISSERPLLDNTRPVSYAAKDSGNWRPISSTPYMAKSSVQNETKSLAQAVSLFPPPLSMPQSSSYMGDEQLTVDSLLQSLGLKKYSILFKAEEVDMDALRQMGDYDLKELGIPMGPRKKILLALMPPSRR